MAYTETLPRGPLVDFVSRHGGIGEVLRNNGFADRDGNLSHEGGLAFRGYTYAISQDEMSVAMADQVAIEMLGLHPGLIWSNWFDEDPEALNYDDIEAELMLGRFDTRAEFWQHVSDLANETMDRNSKPAVLAAMMPEAREYLRTLPPVAYTEDQLSRGLQVGDTCKKSGHPIKTAADLVNRGVAGMGCRACQRPRLVVGMECGRGHKISAEGDLGVHKASTFCRECKREDVRKSRAKRAAQKAAEISEEAA